MAQWRRGLVLNEDYQLVLDYLVEHRGEKFKSNYLSKELNLNPTYIGQIMRHFKEQDMVQYELLSPKAHTYRWWIN